jgi:SSS family transporter
MTFQLGPVDLLVLVAYLGSAVAIGLWASGKAKNLDAYLLGDRDLPWWAILGSIVATETSAATVLSVPAEACGVPGNPDSGTGMQFLQLAIGYIVGRAVIVHFLLPLYFQGKLFTAYEVLDKRFGSVVRRAASLLFLATRNIGDGLRLFLTAIVLQQLAGLPFERSVLITGLATIAYTFFGGMRSVVWNDCIQFVVYMVGAVAAVFVIAGRIDGGWSELWQFAAEHNKLEVFDFGFAWSRPYTFWAGLFGGAFLTLGTHGTDHMMVQRYLSARTQREAGGALAASGVVVFVQFAIFLFIGVELACYYAQHPEIKLAKADEAFAHFIVHAFPENTGVVGLMLAAILAAAMSTLSSSLNSSASALVNDFYVPLRKVPPTSEHLFFTTRALTIIFGVVQVGVAIAAGALTREPTNTVVKSVLSVAGYSAGLLLGVFALGVLTRRTGQIAALAGAVVGLLVLLFVQFGIPALAERKYLPEGLRIAFPWFALIGAGTTFVSGTIISWMIPKRGLHK